jgi:hypothetical protein
MRLLVVFLFLSLTLIGIGQTTAYISAKNGLSLRDKPSTNGAVITKLAYGEKITITGQDSTQIAVEGFSGNWLKVTSSKNSGYIVSAYTLPFPPPKAGTTSFESYFKQISTVSGLSKTGKNPADEYATSVVKTLFTNGAELWQMQAVDDMATTVVLPECSLQQAFQLIRLVGEFGPIIKADTEFPTIDYDRQSSIGAASIRLSSKKDDNTGKMIVDKIHIERTEGAVETLEIFILNGNAIVNYTAGV